MRISVCNVINCTMSKRFVLSVLCYGFLAIKNVDGTDMELRCPPGYTISATTIYESKKNWNQGKSMTCMSCSLESTPANSFDMCIDVNGFTDPDPNEARFEYADGHFRSSPYHFISSRVSECDGLCGNGACTATLQKGSTTLKMDKCDDLALCAIPAKVSNSS